MTGDFSTQFNTSLCLSSSVDCLLIANYYLTCVSIDASVTTITEIPPLGHLPTKEVCITSQKLGVKHCEL